MPIALSLSDETPTAPTCWLTPGYPFWTIPKWTPRTIAPSGNCAPPINRQLSWGNQRPTGANAWSVLASLAATDLHRLGDLFDERTAQAMVMKNRVA